MFGDEIFAAWDKWPLSRMGAWGLGDVRRTGFGQESAPGASHRVCAAKPLYWLFRFIRILKK